MATLFSESLVENAALAWLECLGYVVKHGLEIAPGELLAERGGTVGKRGQARRL